MQVKKRAANPHQHMQLKKRAGKSSQHMQLRNALQILTTHAS